MRRFWQTGLSFLLILSLLCSGLTGITAEEIELGDINADDSINASDALLVLQHSVSLITLTQEREERADVNADGLVNASDALLILQYSVGLIVGFSTEKATSLPWSEYTKVYAANTQAQPTSEIRTTFQQAGQYSGEMDVQSDSVMAYINNLSEVDLVFDSWAENNQSGRQIDVMIPGGRDTNFEYFSLYPERGKKDAQKTKGSESSEGLYLYHANNENVHYMMPTTYYTEYKWTLVDKICQKDPGFVCVEEPEFWYQGCFNDGFYEEWESYYGTEFVDPFSSAEARYMASKLMAYMWKRMLETFGERMAEKYPEVGLVVAAHSTPGYGGNIISGLNGYTSMPYVDAVIGQTWSDTVRGDVDYRGERVSRPFESAFFEYSTYPDSMQEGQVVYTLTDAKADNDSLTWDEYEYLWQETVVAELMQPEINHFQECVWPSRGFTVAPDRYRTIQLSVYNTLHEVGDYGATRYAGTPGVYFALSDSSTYQVYFNAMNSETTSPSYDGISISLIEKGIPLGVKALEYIDDPTDLEDVKILILAYDMQKPQSESVNTAIAQWVKQGGVLLYLSGYNDYDTVSSKWWTEKGQTPYENLLEHLGLDSIQVEPMDYYLSTYQWDGPDGYGESFDEGDFLSAEISYSTYYTGSGFAPLLSNANYVFGFEAKAGKGRVISVGLPSAYYGTDEKGPQQLRDLVEYACRYTDVDYLETDLMAIQRGPFLAAHALDYGGNQTLKGDFMDMFDESLPIISTKELEAGRSALLYDLTELRKADHPVLVHTGANLRSQVIETADTTSFIASGPTNSESASRFLGNGKYPQEIVVTQDGEIFKDYVALWENENGSLLLKINHQADEEVKVTITWGDTPVSDTPAYTWSGTKISINSDNWDENYVFSDTADATRTMKVCRYDAELIYRFDMTEMNDPYFQFDVLYNYLVEVSIDGEHYQTAFDYRDISGTYITGATNRIRLQIVPELYGASETCYVRFSNTDPTKEYGAGISALTIYSKQLE